MAVKKAAGGGKPQEEKAPKGKANVPGASKAKAEPAAKSKPAATATATATKVAEPAPKKAAVKKAAPAPIKLSTSQVEILKKVHSHGEPAGYRPEKKAEQRTLDALQERKLIKRGAKHKESNTYHYLVSNAGKKHLDSQGGDSAPKPGT